MKFILKEKLKGEEPLIGTMLTLPSPEIAELISSMGYDWVFIDGEHSSLDFSQIQLLLQCLVPGCSGVVRVPLLDEVWIKKALDSGAEGIIVPNVKTPEEAAKVVSLCKYPPGGTRSVGIARAHTWGLGFKKYVETVNDDLAIIIQLEHADAFARIDDILDVPGYDAVFIGPYDYSASVGKMGKVDDEEIQRGIAVVREKCFRKKIPLGIFGVNAKAVKPYICQGFMLINSGIDFLHLKESAEENLAALRPARY